MIRPARALMSGLLVLSLSLGTSPHGQETAPETPLPEAGASETIDTAPPGEAAQTIDPTMVDDPVAALAEIEAEITLSDERAAALRAEIEAMAGDRTRQNAALIAAAQRVGIAEIEIADVESRLDDLIVAELEVRGRLDGADAEIANSLTALARISRNPPPALIVDPSDALGSARSAILIAAILPQLQERAETVSADLERLTTITAQAREEEALLLANFAVLEEERLRIATLIVARAQGVEVMSDDLRREEQAAVELAARARTLQELITELNARMESAARTEPEVEPVTDLTPDEIELAYANPQRVEPAVPFEAAQGHLLRPVNGVDVQGFGANDGLGGVSHGISIVTRAEAQVVAPTDGWVLYRGPYLNYGEIVILNTGQAYTALIAGLETVSVDIGQFVQRGEPIGTMGSRTIGRSVTTNAGASQPTLYIELRRDNQPIDPGPWWRTETATT